SFSISGLKNSFWYTRLVSLKTLVVGVYWCEKSWRSQRPPWSQIGQSSGWFARMNSSTDWWASFTTGVLVRTTMPSLHTVLQEVGSVAIFQISTAHMRARVSYVILGG